MRVKVFARNSKGRSDSVWLRSHTLRAPGDHLSHRESQDFLGSSHLLPDYYSRFYSFFTSPLALVVSCLATLVTLTVMTLAIIALVSRRRVPLTASSSSHFNDSGPSDSCDQLPVVQAKEGDDSSLPDAHVDAKKCTCDDEFCDEGVSRQTFTDPYHGRDYGWEGPPDIILYFPYNNSDNPAAFALNEGLALDKSSSPFGMFLRLLSSSPAA